MENLGSYIILPMNGQLVPNLVSGSPIGIESDIGSSNDKIYTNIEYIISQNAGIENVYLEASNSSEKKSGYFISRAFLDSNDTSNDIVYKCSSCDATFNKYNQYLQHLHSHENGTSFLCKKCKAVLNNMRSYHKHIMNHQEEKLFRCTICHDGFNFENNFKVHMALHGHSLVCPICEISFQRLASLKSHLAKHQVEELHICSECSSEFENVVDLRKHIRIHTADISNQQNELTCSFCKVKFETPMLLRHHIASHIKVKKLVHNGKRNNKPQMSNKEYKHKCTICCKTFPKLSLFERHARIHSGERPYVCKVCDKGFTQKGTLQIHMTKHSGIKPFCCTLCPAKFNQKGNLKVHVRKTHTATTEDEKIFKCSQCDCIFKKVASLNGHMTKIHAVDTPEICIASIIDQPKNIDKRLVGNFLNSAHTIIPQLTDNKLEYNVRAELPEDEKISKVYSLKQKFLGTAKVYICTYCDKETKKPSDLIRHLRTHTKEKPFKCFCGNAFSTKSTLLSHMQIHKGNIGKKCLNCSRVLFSKKSWNSHMRKHHTSFQSTTLKSHNYQNLELREIKEKLNIPEKSLMYQHCLSSLPKKVNMKRRTQLNSGERKYKCRICYRTFITHYNLKEHMKFHNGVRKLECAICDKTFSTKSLLKRHMSIHNTFKPYECSHCKKRFKDMSMCGRHISAHEDNDAEQAILSTSICYAADKQSRDQTSSNDPKSTSLLELHSNEILEDLFVSDRKEITIEGTDIEITEDVEKLTSTSSNTALEFRKSEELQTFFVDCTTDVHSEEELENQFFSELDLQPNAIIGLEPINEIEHSPIVFNVQNIISEETLPAVDIINTQIYINNSSGLSESQQPVSLLKNIPKTVTKSIDNIICVPNSMSDNFLANNISLYPNTQISFGNAAEMSSTIPLDSITLQENICLKAIENEEKSIVERLNLLNVSFKESGDNIGNLSVLHCLECKKLFENMALYESHTCLKSVSRRNYITESIDLDKSEKSSVKIKNNKNFSKSESKSQKSLKKNFSCVYCGKEFNSRGAYMRHGDTHQKNIDGLHKCKFCIKKFKKPSDLSRHLRTHTGEKPFACDKCDKKFSLKSTLEGHYRTHNPGATKDFVCELCNSFFTSKSSLKLHMHVHTGMKPHKCSFCDQHFRTLAHKRSHEQKIHSNFSTKNNQRKSKASVGALGVEIITENSQISEHQEIAQSAEIKMSFPDQKNQTVKLTETIEIDDAFLQQLQNSNIIIEVIQDLDPTQQSSMLAIDENNFESMEKISETNAEPYEHTIDENIEIESEGNLDCESERNLECEICHKKYASKDVFRKHMQLHLKNKFICEQCNKWFSTVEALCDHEKLHSGHRPYPCFLCTNNFAELQHLKSHLKR